MLGREVECLAGVIHGFHALEEGVVEDDAVRQFGEHRRNLLSDGIHLIVAVGVKDVEEHAHHSVKQGTRTVKGSDGVLEGRSFGVSNDSGYLRFVFSNGFLEGGHIVLRLHFVESRHAVGRVLLREERVFRVGASHKGNERKAQYKQFFHML